MAQNQGIAATQAASTPATGKGVVRIGVIGVDSSHLPEFARRINERHERGATRCHVSEFWTDGRHDMPEADVAKWKLDALSHGARPAPSLEKMLDRVDAAMVLTVNGNRHLAHALPAIERGLPTYIDKPLTCSLDEALRIRQAVGEHGARCYSASSLRFAPEIAALDDDKLGKLVAIDAFGPNELNESMPGLFFYGVHTIEMVDAIWGPGVEAVRAQSGDARDLVDLRYRDGRAAHLRLERQGVYAFGATVHGLRGVQSFVVDFGPVYDRLIDGMVGFFEGGAAPASLDDLVENIAVMEAGNASMRSGGDWVTLAPTG